MDILNYVLGYICIFFFALAGGSNLILVNIDTYKGKNKTDKISVHGWIEITLSAFLPLGFIVYFFSFFLLGTFINIFNGYLLLFAFLVGIMYFVSLFIELNKNFSNGKLKEFISKDKVQFIYFILGSAVTLIITFISNIF